MAGILWWTPERRRAACELVEAGNTMAETAKILTRRFRRRLTRGAVQEICSARGVKARMGRPPKREGRDAIPDSQE